MATQTKDFEVSTNDPLKAMENGGPHPVETEQRKELALLGSQVPLTKEEEEEVARTNNPLTGSFNIDPSLIIPARYPLSRVLGKHKDDPYVAEVWDRIIASRHADRVEDPETE